MPSGVLESWAAGVCEKFRHGLQELLFGRPPRFCRACDAAQHVDCNCVCWVQLIMGASGATAKKNICTSAEFSCVYLPARQPAKLSLVPDPHLVPSSSPQQVS